MPFKYSPSGTETEFETRSRRRILANKLGIRRVHDINEAESQALVIAQRTAVDRTQNDQRFTAADICSLHHLWLGPIYAWAGQYRHINIGKGGFLFAHAPLITRLMAELESVPLAQYTPCRPAPSGVVAQAIAVVHAELILVHPFRDGNGRVARLLALLMGLQAGLPPLDFSPLEGRGRSRYFAAIRATVGRDYESLTELFTKVIDRTSKRYGASNTL